MAMIRLQDVTKIYANQATMARSQVLTGRQIDRAFAERIVAQADRKHNERMSQGGPLLALDHVNLIVPEGKTMAIVGPSGCGKSTLLNVVAGLDSEYDGYVLYDDKDMRDVSPGDRHIGMVFQNYALYPHFEGRGNLAFFFKIRRATDEETEERIRITSEIMGIGFEELLKRKPGKLSGGEQQRIAVARAVVRNPEVFLFDEPLSNLDAKLRVQTRVEIKRLLRRFEITAIYVTHDQEEAITLAEHVAVMRAGKIEQVGTFQNLRHYPANTFVAGFLGSPPMNLFEGGTIEEGKLQLGEVAVPLPASVGVRVQAGQAITLGVRPEAARLITGDQGLPDGFRLRGLVEVIEPDFAHRSQLVYLTTGQFAYAATGPLDPSLRIGDEVEVMFPADELYFFDTGSEKRLG